MQTSAIGMPIKSAYLKKEAAFTLIEILMVLLIITISFTFAVLAFGDFGEKRRTVLSAEQFVNYIKLAQQQAILESASFQIHVDRSGYKVSHQSGNRWLPIKNPRAFSHQTFPKGTFLSNKPIDVVINDSGDFTPFNVHLGTSKIPSMVEIRGDLNGTLSMLYR